MGGASITASFSGTLEHCSEYRGGGPMEVPSAPQLASPTQIASALLNTIGIMGEMYKRQVLRHKYFFVQSFVTFYYSAPLNIFSKGGQRLVGEGLASYSTTE